MRLAALTAALFLSAAPIAHAEPLIGIIQENEQCTVEPEIITCTGGLSGSSASIYLVDRVESDLRSRFTAKEETTETRAGWTDAAWKVDMGAVEKGAPFVGNCTTFVSAAAQRLADLGFRTDHIWEVIVGNAGQEPSHVILVVQDDSGKRWIAGDLRLNAPRALSAERDNIVSIDGLDLEYSFYFYKKVSDGQKHWHHYNGTLD